MSRKSRKRTIYDIIDGIEHEAQPAALLTTNLPDPVIANQFINDLVMLVTAKLYEDYLDQQTELSAYDISSNS